MTSLLEVATAREATERFSWEALWEFFDGTAEHLNIAHECLDRHHPDATAARIAFADGRVDDLTFGELSRASAQFAHWLEKRGVTPGQAVGVMMEPSREFYAAVFGAIKRGAVAVPLYTLFGPDAVRDRMEDCEAAFMVIDAATEQVVAKLDRPFVVYDAALRAELTTLPEAYTATTAASDTAVLQYTSGTTRELPEAVRHDHRSVVTLAPAGLFALGLKPGDRYFCPSSPAWGHGLWHGTIAPWSLGIALGAYSGRFSADRLLDVLRDLQITNLAAASTVYRMLLGTGRVNELVSLEKASYTGEELDSDAQAEFRRQTGVPVCGMYGTTETGVIIVNFPGFTDHEPKPGALGKPMPGTEVTVLDAEGRRAPAGVPGEISVRRRGEWFRAKDLGSVDEDGFFYYGGRADDVIISAGWTISPLEVERTLLRHPDVVDAAVVGVPDPTRGLVVKAFLVTNSGGSDELTSDLQERVKTELSPHEYPRLVEYVTELPKTANGKVNRRALRESA
jgi:acetyl-CoA synthetase